jgi:GNAT superfamily N-acetyltransferase
MDLNFQPAIDERDYEDALRIRNEQYSHYPISLDESRNFDASLPPSKKWMRYVGREVDGACVVRGLVRQHRWSEDDVFELDILFLDGALTEERWLGCLATLESQAADWGARTLVLAPSTRTPRAVAASGAAGFVEAQRQPLSTLDVADFDEGPYATIFNQLWAERVEILTLEEFSQDRPATWQREFWRLMTDVLSDVPSPTPVREVAFEDFLRHITLPNYSLKTRFLARHEDRLVALSEFEIPSLAPTQGTTGLTGVRREYRRRGLATALKATAIAEARRFGVVTLWTDNEENNPMYQLNLHLGFRKAWEYVVMIKHLGESQSRGGVTDEREQAGSAG